MFGRVVFRFVAMVFDDFLAASDAAVSLLAAEVARLTREALAALRGLLPSFAPEHVLTTRVLELLIHSDDLAVSVGVATPEAPDSAYDRVIGLLGRVAVRRHGPLPVLRALSRAERVPESIAAM